MAEYPISSQMRAFVEKTESFTCTDTSLVSLRQNYNRMCIYRRQGQPSEGVAVVGR